MLIKNFTTWPKVCGRDTFVSIKRALRDVTQSFVKSQCEAPCGGLGRRHLGSVRLHQCACSVIQKLGKETSRCLFLL